MSGHITYDHYQGHVCTCTAKDEKEDYVTYGQTVHVVRTVEPTESGSFLYSCERCGATTWSGL